MNFRNKANVIPKHVSATFVPMLSGFQHFVSDKEAIDGLSPGDAVVVFTPDSQCSFDAVRGDHVMPSIL